MVDKMAAESSGGSGSIDDWKRKEMDKMEAESSGDSGGIAAKSPSSVGMRVKILGLVKGAHHNNVEGSISVAWNETTERVGINLDNGVQINAKLSNIMFLKKSPCMAKQRTTEKSMAAPAANIQRGALKPRKPNEEALLHERQERVSKLGRERSVERNSNSSSRRGLTENAALEMESDQVLNKGLQTSTESNVLGGDGGKTNNAVGSIVLGGSAEELLHKDVLDKGGKPSNAVRLQALQAELFPNGVGGASAWDEGAPRPKPYVVKGFTPMVPLFNNIDSPTPQELETFYQTRTFILFKKSISNSVEDCISLASFEDLHNKPNEFSRLTPELFKSAPKGVHMVYIGVGEGIPDSQAEEIIKTVVHNLPKIKDTPPPTGIDNGGNFTTTARQLIETVGYYEGKPNTSILLGGLKAILTANSSVASILDCKTPKKISQQLQFDGVLGLYQNDIIASVEAAAGPSIKVSNFHFSPNRFSESSIITTSAACRMTITHYEGVLIPTTFTVPSWAGLDKVITYKRLFQYTNQKSGTPSNQPKESATPPSASRYKTTMCRQYKQGIPCPYDLKCQFAHGEAELHKNQPGSNPTGAGMHEQAPTSPSPKPTPPTPKPTTLPSSPAPTPSSIAASLEAPISVVLGIDEDPYAIATKGKGKGNSPPCGPLRPTSRAQASSPIGQRNSIMDLSRPMASESFSKSPVHQNEKLVEQQSRIPFGNQDEVSLRDIPLYPNIASTSQ